MRRGKRQGTAQGFESRRKARPGGIRKQTHAHCWWRSKASAQARKLGVGGRGRGCVVRAGNQRGKIVEKKLGMEVATLALEMTL